MLCSAFSWLDKVCIEASCTDLCYWELYICAIAEVVIFRCAIESNCQDLHEYDWVINRCPDLNHMYALTIINWSFYIFSHISIALTMTKISLRLTLETGKNYLFIILLYINHLIVNCLWVVPEKMCKIFQFAQKLKYLLCYGGQLFIVAF